MKVDSWCHLGLLVSEGDRPDLPSGPRVVLLAPPQMYDVLVSDVFNTLATEPELAFLPESG
eukprot:3574523-Pyramimonas_sp.AAC.1